MVECSIAQLEVEQGASKGERHTWNVDQHRSKSSQAGFVGKVGLYSGLTPKDLLM